MYIHLVRIIEAVANLEFIHPFYGITFLVCKKAELKVGEEILFHIDTLETEFLEEFYQPYKNSDYFFRLSRVSDKAKSWVHKTKYASSTLQSIRTRSAFAAAFIHEKNSTFWGWQPDYLGVLRANLSLNIKSYRGRKIPLFYLAVWLYRARKWDSKTTPQDIIETFLAEFKINEAEQELFDLEFDEGLYKKTLLQESPVTSEDLRENVLGLPPDIQPEAGETLAMLELYGVGPAHHLEFEPAKRLNLLTGDNGLGKTFLLECSWWALTGDWTSRQSQANPRTDVNQKSQMSFQIASENSRLEKVTVNYNRQRQKWNEAKERPTIQGLVIYARVDGSFAIWNPIRQSLLGERQSPQLDTANPALDLQIPSHNVWNGIEGQTEGLVRDWVKWQNSPDKYPFDIFRQVLRRLSPPDLGILEPGEPIRLAYEPTEIPTLKHPYGEVPIIHASAAVRRILALAYLIVWTWNEHLIYSKMAHKGRQRRIVILVDEIEAHLHPLWQRTVLPALLDISTELSRDLQTQFLIATHSPLVMASAESVFNDETDGLFHIDLTQNGEVEFKEVEFVRQGSVDAWLTSEVFDLRHARSLQSERVIEEAKNLQGKRNPSKEEIQAMTSKLSQTLASHDEFWSRWIYFAAAHGVKQ